MNCGWDNLPEAKVCLKCGQSLEMLNCYVNRPHGYTAGRAQEEVVPKPTVLNAERTVESCRSTVVYPSKSGSSMELFVTECPKCHYPVTGGFTTCPSCGTSLSTTSNELHRPTIRRPMKQIIDTVVEQKPHCSLTLIPEEHENIVAEPIVYEGNSVILNRDNTEPANRTITSKEQAEIVWENGHWFLKDCSEFKTTYIQVSRKMEILPGDIIVLGDRRFKFESDKKNADGE